MILDHSMIRRYHGCLRKHRCHSQAEAAQRAEEASLLAGELITAYKCEYCTWWHVGHPIANASRPWLDDDIPRCSLCGAVIPAHRVERATKHNLPLLTCSSRCARRPSQPTQARAS